MISLERCAMASLAAGSVRGTIVGSDETRLVVVRGNSASGKSSVAAGIRDRFGRGLALVGQDNLRRIVLRERDRPGGANIGLIDTVARYALDAGYHVVIEGILYADRYGGMLVGLVGDHRGVSRCYYLDIPIDETLVRHASKADPEYLAHVTERELREWYRERDLLPGGIETVIGRDSALHDTVDHIMRETGLANSPAPESGNAALVNGGASSEGKARVTEERYRPIADAIQVLLRPDGRALCVRKAAGAVHGAGQLTVVGGHLEKGEALDQAARREAREETGIDIDARHQEFCGLVHYNSPLGGGRIAAVFVAQRWTGEPYNAEPHKHNGLFWVPTERPPKDCHPYTVAIFRMLTEGPSYLALNWTNPAQGGSQ